MPPAMFEFAVHGSSMSKCWSAFNDAWPLLSSEGAVLSNDESGKALLTSMAADQVSKAS